MTRGLSRAQIGVTEQMIEAYGEHIWDLSHNVQLRRGDPVRERDWTQIEAQRPATGMADIEIAARIGLARDQVTFIRLVLERRKFRRGHYYRLLELGGGRRFRAERFTPHEERGTFTPEALALRRALAFDADLSNRYLRLGFWTADTIGGLVRHWAAERPGGAALIVGEATLTYAELHDRARRLANALLALGLRRGDVIALQHLDAAAFGTAAAGISMMGGVAAMLPPEGGGALVALLARVHARAAICRAAQADDDPPTRMRDARRTVASLEHIIVAGGADGGGPASTYALDRLIEDGADADIADPAVAADPAAVLFGGDDTGPPKAIVHCSHTLLSGSRALSPAYAAAPDDGVLTAVPFTAPLGLWALGLAFGVGASISALAPGTDLAAAMEAGRPTVLFAAADQLAAWVRNRGSGRFDSVRRMTVLGASWPSGTLPALRRAIPNAAFGQAWGQGEFFVGLHSPPDEEAGGGLAQRAAASPDAEIRIADGALELCGGSLFAGYLDDEAATGAAFTDDGWFRTGACAAREADGRFRLIEA